MAEIFGMTVSMKLVPENIPEVKKQIERSLKTLPAGIGKIAGGLARGTQTVAGGFGGAVGGVARTLGGAAKGMGGALAGGIGAGAALGAAGIGVAAVITILKMINDRIKKMLETLKEASAEFKASKELIDKMWNIALRPIGNLMATLMRPFLIMSMQFLRPKLAAMQEILRETGGKPGAEDIERIKEIWKGTAEGLLAIQQDMMSIIRPIAGEVEGFISAAKILFNNWLDGMGSWFKGLAQGFRSTFDPMPESLAQYILQSLKDGSQVFSELPGDMKRKFIAWLTENQDAIKTLPADIKSQIIGWISNPEGAEALKGLASEVNTAFGADLMTVDAAEVLGDLAPAFASWTGVGLMTPEGTIALGNVISNFVKSVEGYLGLPAAEAGDTWWDRIKDAVVGLIDRIKKFITGEQHIITGESGHQRGLFSVPETGSYLLHRGEQVVPATRAESGKSVVLNMRTVIQGGIQKDIDIDSIVRRSSRMTELVLRRRGII